MKKKWKNIIDLKEKICNFAICIKYTLYNNV